MGQKIFNNEVQGSNPGNELDYYLNNIFLSKKCFLVYCHF